MCQHNQTEIIYLDMAKQPHFAKEKCLSCGAHIKFISRPKVEIDKTKRENNSNFKAMHKKRTGFLYCCWCGISEKDGCKRYEVDHKLPLIAGGKDEFENTMTLCNICHTLKHSTEALRERQARLNSENTEAA